MKHNLRPKGGNCHLCGVAFDGYVTRVSIVKQALPVAQMGLSLESDLKIKLSHLAKGNSSFC